jgi:hypothetical protein
MLRKPGCEDEMDSTVLWVVPPGCFSERLMRSVKQREKTEKREFHPTLHGTPNGKLPY